MVVWGPNTHHPEHYARQVLDAAMYLHVTFEKDFWLWRGQAQHKCCSPGMHTRVLRLPKAQQTEATVRTATKSLLEAARSARLDQFDNARLPDIALLSHLQHHGAATPLLDVTVDPLVALWMVANATVEIPGACDGQTGYLFGIRQPELRITTMDSRPYEDISKAMAATDVYWYRSPDVSERLRIQRGSFIVGPLDTVNAAAKTIPLDEGSSPDWLAKRMTRRGQKNPVASRSDVLAIRVRGACKSYLRRLLGYRQHKPKRCNRPLIGP